MEEWRPVKDFENYEVSSFGRVRNWLDSHRNRRDEPKIVKPRNHNKGYLAVSLSNKSLLSQRLIHRLVLEAFTENPGNPYTPDHRDGNKKNNHLSNLWWADKTQQSINRPHREDYCIREKANGSYQVQIKRYNKLICNKTFKTLEEAREYRDSILILHP